MPSLDTNVLVRYLVQDDARQTRVTHKFISEYVGREQSLFISNSVILETEWVLRSSYGFSKESYIDVLVQLLETKELAFSDEASLELALFFYRENNVDFADSLHAATAHVNQMLPMVTFDRQATKIDGVESL